MSASPSPAAPVPISQKVFDFALVFLAVILILIGSATALPYGIVIRPETSTGLLMGGSFLLGIAIMRLGAQA